MRGIWRRGGCHENARSTFGGPLGTPIKGRSLPGSVAAEIDERVLLEILRQGERLLATQERAHDQTLQRTGELLRLSVASLGGFIVIAGILAASDIAVDTLAFMALAVGLVGPLVAAATLAFALTGIGSPGGLAMGPDLNRVVSRVQETAVTPATLLESVATAVPDWVRDNRHATRRLQRLQAFAVGVLGAGVALLLVALLYILGGTIVD